MHCHVGMQAESIDGSAAWTERQIHALRADLIPNPSHTASGVGAISRSSGHGSGVKPGQPGLISTKGIRLFRIAVRPKVTAIEQPGHSTLPELEFKLEEYIANGALLGFLVYPPKRQVYVYRPGK